MFAVANNTDKIPCYLCARMRRGYLYKQGSRSWAATIYKPKEARTVPSIPIRIIKG